MPSNHLILCHPLLLLPLIFPSIRVFSNESALCIRWPKYCSFSISISPFSAYPGLISFRMDWLDLLAVRGTLKSLLQHHKHVPKGTTFFSALVDQPLYYHTVSLPSLIYCYSLLGRCFRTHYDSASLTVPHFLTLYQDLRPCGLRSCPEQAG